MREWTKNQWLDWLGTALPRLRSMYAGHSPETDEALEKTLGGDPGVMAFAEHLADGTEYEGQSALNQCLAWAEEMAA